MHNKTYAAMAVLSLSILLAGCGDRALLTPQSQKQETEAGEAARETPELFSKAVSFSDFLYEHYQEDGVHSLLVDLTHDGEDDLLVFSTREMKDADGQTSPSTETVMELYTRVGDDIVSIYSDTANDVVTSGYRWYYLYEEDDWQYLVQYSPVMSNGMASYHYRIFSLTADGTIQTLREEQADYDSIHTDEEVKSVQYDQVQELIQASIEYREIPLIELGDDVLAGEEGNPLHYSYIIDCGRLATVKELDSYYQHGYGDDVDMYEVLGINSDEASAYMHEFISNVLNDEREEASEMIRFPRKVITPEKTVIINSPEDFLSYYDEIFTEDFIEQLRLIIDQELICNYMGVWIGDGEVWMKKYGTRLYIESIGLAPDRAVRSPGESGA